MKFVMSSWNDLFDWFKEKYVDDNLYYYFM